MKEQTTEESQIGGKLNATDSVSGAANLGASAPSKNSKKGRSQRDLAKKLSPRAHHGKGTPTLKPKLGHKYLRPNQRWNKVLEVAVECLVNHPATPMVPTEATCRKKVAEEIEIGIVEKPKLRCNRSKVAVAAASPSMP
jgi:hypothetical protein